MERIIDEQNSVLTYLMFDGTYHKIGRSLNVKKRFLTMRVGNPNLKIICYGKRNVEKILHTSYDKKRINGEWFKLNDDDILDIIRIITGEELSIDESIEKYFISAHIKKGKEYIPHPRHYSGRDVYIKKFFREYPLISPCGVEGVLGLTHGMIRPKDKRGIPERHIDAIIEVLNHYGFNKFMEKESLSEESKPK